MFSIVIPLFNKEDSIGKTIRSVLSQSYAGFELIIVNDGSTDTSVKIVRKFRDERLRLINKENGGVSSARNEGIANSKFNLIALLDGDDWWDCDYLEEMSKFIDSYPKASLYGCRYAKVVRNKAYPEPRNPPLEMGYITDYFSTADKFHLFWSSSVILRKEILEITGCFDERISSGEDLDLWYRIAAISPVAYLSKVLSYYNLDDSSRALHRTHPIEKHYLNYILDKFDSPSDAIENFQKRYVVENLRPYYFDKKYHARALELLRELKSRSKGESLPLLFEMPYFMSKSVYKYGKLIKSLVKKEKI